MGQCSNCAEWHGPEGCPYEKPAPQPYVDPSDTMTDKPTASDTYEWPSGIVEKIRRGPYSVAYDPEPCDNNFRRYEPMWFPRGPGDGFGDHGGRLLQSTRFPTKVLTQQVVAAMNVAYWAGYAKAKKEIRAALGVEDDR